MKRLISLLLPAFAGCSVYMSATLPIARPVEYLQPGSYMGDIDGKFGYPIAAGEDFDGVYSEQIQFIDGVPIGWKVFRFCAHTTCDALTYCLWEFVGTPIELMNNDYPIYTYYLVYDDQGKLIRAVPGDSEEGRKFATLKWTVPYIEGLKVNKDNSLRMNYLQINQ